MGLVKEGDNFVTLTDILGAEDAFGDMDFKVAGTADFVTALQLDTKIDGLPAAVLGDALRQAREARLVILDVMNAAISEPRAEVRDTAPKIVTIEIPLDKIGEVIGAKGKMINAMQQETGADINVDDNGVIGTVTVGARDGAAVKEAIRRIELILDPPKAEVGATYRGKVVNITKFGAFVNILPGRDGLLHISKLSKLSQGKRVERVEDVADAGRGPRGPRGRHRPSGQGVALARRRVTPGGWPGPARPASSRTGAGGATAAADGDGGRAVRDGLVRRDLGSRRPVRPSATSARRRAWTHRRAPELGGATVAQRRGPGPGTAAQPPPPALSTGRRRDEQA